MPRLRSFLAALLLVASALIHPTSRADEPALRARLASARQAQAAQRSLPEGVWLSIEHALDVSERIAGSFAPQAKQWAARAGRWLERAERGEDPIVAARGEILMRGYRSPISQHLQGYAIYTPKDYDPAKKYPLLVMLHGGSANGNLFLGVVLGNNMSWKEYDQHLWDEYAPRWSPDFIVVAPDGFGHVMWRWMGEQDVLDVIADVQKHYAIDPERIALGGLSNGGVGAYNIGMRHASRFSIVTPIAGAPSWLQYAGGRIPKVQERAMVGQSGMQLAENAINTDLRYYHGRLDGGPMKPRFIDELTAYIKTLGVPFTERWFEDAGHDLLYLVHRHGKIYNDLLAPARRKQKPAEVRLVTSDYRASQQHWVQVTRIAGYPAMARVRAVAQADRIDVEASEVRAFELDLRQAPISASGAIKIAVNGHEVCSGPRSALGDVARVRWDEAAKRFVPGAPSAAGALEKRPKLSGPITDAYYDATIHVYGTGDAAATAALKRTAERSASGSPLWLWRVKQRVLADTEVTDVDLQNNHVVVYATPGSNALLERMLSKLPMKLDAEGVQLGSERFTGRGVGVKLIYPNPLAANRYVIVQAAPTTAGVDGGRNLPDFLPDYVVYDASTTATRPRLTYGGKQTPRAMGYFDDAWQLRAEHARALGSEPLIFANAASVPAPVVEPPAAATLLATAPASATSSTEPLPMPPVPTVFAAAEDTPAGRAARQIAKRVALFPSYRSRIRNALWSFDPRASWSIRDDTSCLQALATLGVQARAYAGELTTPVPTPVEVTSPVAGLGLRMIHARRTLLMSCELAARLPALAALLRSHGVTSIDVMSSYRDHPWASFHTLGLALDISKFVTAEGPLVVKSDFEMTPATPTCDGAPPAHALAQRLRAIACALADSHLFSSVLTPNYNAGHRDHFHVDVRPDDPRIFLR